MDALSLMYGTAPSALMSFLKEAGYGFVTPTPATHFRVNERFDNQRAETLADAFGWSRPFDSSLLPDPLFRALREAGIITESETGWKSALRASTLDGDLFLHSAFPTIGPDAVFFGPDTYRFARAIKNHLMETRLLDRALDLGCGSGAGGVVVAKNSICRELILADINEAALPIARLNANAARGARRYDDLQQPLRKH
jgi:Methyltransferase small domain